MIKKVGGFFAETKQELNKVTWPSKDEVYQATLVVIITTFLIAFYIGVIDFFLSAVMRVLIG
jgi:preprotein translocase subunit SecE